MTSPRFTSGAMMLMQAVFTPAFAQTPVVYSDVTAPEAVALTVARTGLPEDQLEAVPLTKLMEAPAALLGAGALRRCPSEPSDGEQIRAVIARAEAARLAGDLRASANGLDRAVAQLGCLSDVVEGSIAAGAFLRRGAALAANGNEEAARGEFVTALSLDPKLAWLESLPSEGQAAFEALQANGLGTRATLQFLPAESPGGPWLDGVEVADQISAPHGLHLLQYTGPTGVQSAWLSVGGDATVVVPRSFRATIMASVGQDGAASAGLGGLLAAGFPERDAGYVTHEGGLWLIVREGRDLMVSELVPRPPPEPEPLTPKERRRQKRAERKKQR